MTSPLAARMAALADQLEADAPHSTSGNGLFQAAEEIRAELAADEQSTALPPAVQTAIATLRTAAYWLPDDGRSMLLDAAHRAETNWDGGCCPVCEETFCDGGCPLEDVRAGLYDGLMGDYEDPTRGLRGNLLAMVNADMPQPSYLKDAINGMVNHLADTVEGPTPFREQRRAVVSPDCYMASFGWVHSRPSCRCSK